VLLLLLGEVELSTEALLGEVELSTEALLLGELELSTEALLLGELELATDDCNLDCSSSSLLPSSLHNPEAGLLMVRGVGLLMVRGVGLLMFRGVAAQLPVEDPEEDLRMLARLIVELELIGGRIGGLGVPGTGVVIRLRTSGESGVRSRPCSSSITGSGSSRPGTGSSRPCSGSSLTRSG